MSNTIFYVLIIPLLVFMFYSYQYKNPYLLFMSALMLVFIGLMFYTGTIFIDNGSRTCEVVVSNSTILSNTTTSYQYDSFCYNLTNTSLNFNQVTFGTVFLVISLYFIFQAVLGVMDNNNSD